MRLAGPVLVIAALALGATVARAAMRPAGSGLARILSPRGGGLVPITRSEVVRVRVRTSPRVRTFRADVGMKPVTARFSAPRRGIRTAKLRLGDGVRLGRNNLSVDTTGGGASDFDSSVFTVARRRTGLLSLTTRRRRAPRQMVIVRSRVRSPRYRLRARLNGRPATSSFLVTGAKRRVARLDVDDGLRYGRNRLVVIAIHAGTFDREVARFTVRRRRPLIGAGSPVLARAGIPVRLDATASRPAKRSHRLRYRWRIVRAPKGSPKPRLRGARTARPTFVPHAGGRFKVRVTVREVARSKGRSAGAGNPSPPSTDTVTAVTQPADPPIGVPIQTIPNNGHGITVPGDQPVGGPGIQMLVLERDSRAENTSLSRNYPLDDAGLAAFNQAIGEIDQPTATDPGELLILTGGGNVSAPLSSGWVSALEGAYAQFGGTLAPFGSVSPAQAFASGEWSLIGVRGMDKGQAAQNYGAQPPGNRSEPGSLNGYLQLDTNHNYTFNFGTYIPFDTAVPGSTTAVQNTISIGSPTSFVDETFTSQSLPDGTSGFHVLVLGQGDLRKIDEETFPTNNANGAIEQNVSQLASYLQEVASGTGPFTYPRLVIVQSIGQPQARSNNWPQQLAPAIASLGGTADVFNGPNGTAGGYTLVGGSNLTGFGAEQSSSITGLPARLTGVLRPNRQDQLVGDVSDPSGKAGYDIYQIAYQRPADWPVPSTPGQQQAMTCIAGNWPGGLVNETDVRPNYYLEQMGWGGWTIPNLEIAAGRCAPGTDFNSSICVPGAVSTDDVTAVFCALVQEVPIVSELGSYFNGLQNALMASHTVSEAELEQLGHQIAVDIQPPSQSTASLKRGFDIAAEALRVAAVFVPVPVAPAALGAAAGGLQLTTDFLDDSNGNTATAAVETATANLNVAAAKQMLSTYQNMDKVYDLLVSDYGKLSAAGSRQGQWAAQSNAGDYIKSLQLSAQQWFYEGLVPVAYRVYDVDQNPPQGCIAGNPPIIPVFQNAPDYSWVATASGSKILWTSALQGSDAMPPPEGLVGPMFNPKSTDNTGNPNWVGLYPQWFFNQNFDPSTVDCH